MRIFAVALPLCAGVVVGDTIGVGVGVAAWLALADVIVGRRAYTPMPMARSIRIIAPTRVYSIRFGIV